MKYPCLSACLAVVCLLVTDLQAIPAGFSDDLAAAKVKAKAAHKDILVDFTGSDWCGWCIKLDKDIFSQPGFSEEAGRNFELVQLDFPQAQGKQTAEITARNKAWKSELGSSSFPDVLLVDENGRVFARTSYRSGGAKPYLEHLEVLRQGRIQRDAALAKAEKSSGHERAKLLDEALSALHSDEVVLKYYRNEVNELISLDTRDQGGLQSKYKLIFKRQKCENEIDRLCTGDGAVMLTKLKEYAAKKDIPIESQQYALYMAGAVACERLLKDPQQALELINQAAALAPNSLLAGNQLKESKLRLEARLAKEQRKAAGKPTPGS